MDQRGICQEKRNFSFWLIQFIDMWSVVTRCIKCNLLLVTFSPWLYVGLYGTDFEIFWTREKYNIKYLTSFSSISYIHVACCDTLVHLAQPHLQLTCGQSPHVHTTLCCCSCSWNRNTSQDSWCFQTILSLDCIPQWNWMKCGKNKYCRL